MKFLQSTLHSGQGLIQRARICPSAVKSRIVFWIVCIQEARKQHQEICISLENQLRRSTIWMDLSLKQQMQSLGMAALIIANLLRKKVDVQSFLISLSSLISGQIQQTKNPTPLSRTITLFSSELRLKSDTFSIWWSLCLEISLMLMGLLITFVIIISEFSRVQKKLLIKLDFLDRQQKKRDQLRLSCSREYTESEFSSAM